MHRNTVSCGFLFAAFLGCVLVLVGSCGGGNNDVEAKRSHYPGYPWGPTRPDPITLPKCPLTPHTKQNHNPAWAKLQVAADLGEKAVKAALNGLPDRAEQVKHAATVAIVDTGFDTGHHELGMDALSFRTEKGHASAGSPDTDEDGHGTAVTGVVVGHHIGITSSVNVIVYRVTESNAGGKTTAFLLDAAIEKACENADIVNVSWGSLFDEIRYEPEKAAWYETAKKKGCLIVKAAGNSGVRTKRPAIPLDAPYITVLATNEFTQTADFSTLGNIAAPGEGVFSHLSHQHAYGYRTQAAQTDLTGFRTGPVSGTSFSAPIVAGVAGQVLTILRSKGVVPTDPLEKIALIKAILVASAQWTDHPTRRKDMVNALRASIIANALSKALVTTDIGQLVALGKASVNGCGQPLKSCSGIAACQDQRRCTNELRLKYFTCSETGSVLVGHLYDGYLEMKEQELMMQLLFGVTGDTNLLGRAQYYLDSRWNRNLTFWGSVDNFSFGLNLLFLATRLNLNAFLSVKKMQALVRSFGFSWEFIVTDPLKQNIWNGAREEVYERFVSVFQKTKIADQAHMIMQIPSLSASKTADLGLLYVLWIYRKALDGSVVSAMRTKGEELASMWLDRRLRFGSYQEHMFLMLFSFLSDAKVRIIQHIQKGLDPKDWMLHQFALSKTNTALDANEKLSLARDILRVLSTNEVDALEKFRKQVVTFLFEHGTSFDVGNLFTYFVSNRMATMDGCFPFNRRPKYKPHDDFNAIPQVWKRLLRFNIDNAKGALDLVNDRFVGKDRRYCLVSLSNLMEVWLWNDLLERTKRKSLVNDVKPDFLSLLSQPTQALVGRDKDVFNVSLETLEELSRPWCVWFYKDVELAKSVGRILHPLYLDIKANAEFYKNATKDHILLQRRFSLLSSWLRFMFETEKIHLL